VRQHPLIHRTLRTGRLSQVPVAVVTAPTDGFVADIDIDAIGTALADLDGSAEVVYLRSVGSYVAFQDPLAEVRAERAVDVAGLVDSVAAATHLVQDRDIDRDPAYGIKQLTTIAWRSISTSQQNPGPGAAAINAFHDLLARWSVSEERDGKESPVAVVYPDNVMSSLFGGLESLAVVASEAMQHQTYAAILNVLAVTFDRLDAAERRRAEDLVLRSLSGLGDHVLTLELDDALATIAATLDAGGATETAHAVRTARNQLAESIGSLNSRATRIPKV
jgi:hypothetical protein